MNGISGLGPGQPIRPVTPAGIPAAREAGEVEAAPDAVTLGLAPLTTPTRHETVVFSGLGDELFMRDFEVPDRSVAAPPPPARPAVEEIGGFIVAGASPSAPGLTPGAGVGAANPTAPLAMLEEPQPQVQSFPDLDLNGPGSADGGLWSMAGTRLA